jgi:sec-independent protein translocase protein TatC
MSLGQHLVELRKRIVIAAIAILVGAVAGWFLAPFIQNGLDAPLKALSHGRVSAAHINYTTPGQAFDVRLQIAFTIGIVLSSVVWLYQIWAFIVPGLKRREKRYIVGFLGTAIPLFLAGCAVGWLIFPHMVELLGSFAPSKDVLLYSAKDYIDFVLKLVIAIGVGFVLPVFLVLLNFIGVISAKAIIRGWRIAVILITLFTATVTPSADIISMFILAAPMIALYFAAWFVARLHDRSAARREAALAAEFAV